MRLGIWEIIKQVREAASDDDRVALLRRYDSGPLRHVLRYAYDPRITWILPDGAPPYKPLPKEEHVGAEYMLLKEARTLYLFVEGGEDSNPNVSQSKRELMYVDLLEYVHPEDAIVLLQAKARDIPGVSREVVLQAFPGLFPSDSIVTKVKTAVMSVVAPKKGIYDGKTPEQIARIKERRRQYEARKRAERDALRQSQQSQNQEQP